MLGPLRLELWPPDELQSDDALPAIYEDLGFHCGCPVAADMARVAGAHGALLNVDYEALREMIEDLMSLAEASRSRAPRHVSVYRGMSRRLKGGSI